MKRLVILLAATVLAGCGVTAPSPSPSPSSAPPSSPPPSSPATSPSSSDGQACPIPTVSGDLPSNRLIDLDVDTTDTGAALTFFFDTSTPGSAPGEGSLRAAQPPFFAGGSGEEIEVDGSRFIEIRFEGVQIADDSGQPVYAGPPEVRPDFGPLAELVVTEQFEGVTTFIGGLTTGDCVELSGDPAAGTVLVEIGRP